MHRQRYRVPVDMLLYTAEEGIYYLLSIYDVKFMLDSWSAHTLFHVPCTFDRSLTKYRVPILGRGVCSSLQGSFSILSLVTCHCGCSVAYTLTLSQVLSSQ